MTIQERIKTFVQDNKLETSLEHRMLDLMSELGELNKEVLKASKYGKESLKLTETFADELGDVGFSLLCIANQTNLNLEACIQNALSKYQERLKQSGSASSGY